MGCAAGKAAAATPPAADAAAPAAPAAPAEPAPTSSLKPASSMKDETKEEKTEADKGEATKEGKTPGSSVEPKKKKKKKEKVKTDPAKKKAGNQEGMLNALALQFPNINKSFKLVFKAFDSFHTAGQGIKEEISCDRLADVLNHVVGDGDKKFTEDESKALFSIADLDASKSLAFREFLISIAMGYYLSPDKSKEGQSETFRMIQKGFKVVEKAFHDIDADGGGSIDAEELKAALFATATVDNQDVLEARFKELDFNGDGDIMLPEFVYGMVSWVGFGEDDDEDEE